MMKINAENQAAMAAECDTVGKMPDHPNVIKFYDYGKAEYKDREIFYIVMEYAGLGDMVDVVMDTGAFDEKYARYYGRQFCDALAHCHKNSVVHRDIKLENCMMNKEYDLKIMDFGMATDIEGTLGQGMCNTELGTPAYRAPE